MTDTSYPNAGSASIRPDTYRESFAAIQPLLEIWRRRPIIGGLEICEVVECPACQKALTMTKTSFGSYLSAHCSTAFCVHHQEYRG